MKLTREEAKEYAKEPGRLERYLQDKGIDTAKAFHCLTPGHKDNKPSMRYDKKTDRVKCFSCNIGGDIFDVIGWEYGLSNDLAKFDKTYEVLGIEIEGGSSGVVRREPVTHEPAPKPEPVETLPDSTEYFNACHARIGETDYWKRRGLSRDVVDRFNIGYDPAWRHPNLFDIPVPTTPRLIIPTSAFSYLARDIRDNLTEKEMQYSKQKAGRIHFMNPEALQKSKTPVFVTEAEIDAMSIIEAYAEAMALGSTAKVTNFLNYLKDNRPVKPLIIALDNDTAGEKAADTLEAGLKEQGIPFYRPKGLYGVHKDANETLVADRTVLKESIQAAISQTEAAIETARDDYNDNFASAMMDGFWADVKSQENAPIPTGFKELDKILRGGLRKGLITLGAVSSGGKSTYVLQIADYIAAHGRDVLILSLEMGKYELIAKSLSRLTYEIDKNHAKDEIEIATFDEYNRFTEEDKATIAKADKQYREYANHIVIIEGEANIGVEEIRGYIERHMSVTHGNKPVVIVDYLQILKPEDPRMNDKMNTDAAITKLRRMARFYKIPVIVISSFNRDSYKNDVNMASFKESGMIEYSSDVLIGLQLKRPDKGETFNEDQAYANNPRRMEIKIMKQRKGPKNKRIGYEFYTSYSYFKET